MYFVLIDNLGLLYPSITLFLGGESIVYALISAKAINLFWETKWKCLC